MTTNASRGQTTDVAADGHAEWSATIVGRGDLALDPDLLHTLASNPHREPIPAAGDPDAGADEGSTHCFVTVDGSEIVEATRTDRRCRRRSGAADADATRAGGRRSANWARCAY
jgi:hypothetical protein